MKRILLLLWLGATAAAHAEVVDVREGTNLALAIHPANEYLVIDLLGGLWRMPLTGGGATALIPAGSGVAQPRFDPTGESIVFQRWLDGQWDIWRLTPGTDTLERLTDTDFDEREPEFSADGRAVIFAGNRSGRYSLWSLELESAALRQLTDEPGDARFPTVYSDGTLAYVSLQRGRSEIRLREGSPRGRTIVQSTRQLAAPSWRPGGGVLVVNERIDGRTSDLALFIDADEPIWRRLTDAEDVFAGRAGWISADEYVYAADGALWRRGIASTEKNRVLLFAGVDVEEVPPAPASSRLDAAGPHPISGINGLVHHEPSNRAAFSALGDLWLYDDGELLRLTDDRFSDRSPQFTPDGEWLVFSSDRGGTMDIWRLRIDSGQLLQLTSATAHAIAPRVSGDGRHVAFLVTERLDASGATDLRLMELGQAFSSTTLASGLVAPGGLTWQGRFLRLTARDAAIASDYPQVFETAASAETTPTAAANVDLSDLIGRRELRWSPAVPDSAYVIQAGRLFDGVSTDYRYHVDIHIEGQRITDIVGRDRLPLPDRVVDARDLTVVPGLIDVHTHLGRVASSQLGRTLLASGITTVSDVSADWRGALELAEAWASGQQPGPRVVVTPSDGLLEITMPATTPIAFGSTRRVLGGLRHALAEQLTRDGLIETEPPSAEAGAGGAVRPRIALSTLGRSYGDIFELVRGSQVFLATGLGAIDSDARAESMPALTDGFEWIMRNSGRVAIGTDAPGVGYGSGFHHELALLAAQGMPEDQILRYATAGGAIALGLSLETGTLESGRLADLLVIDGDPLNEIGDLEQIVTVVVGGMRHSSESLTDSR
ncbi:MAG TPA: amidohydrolase family protein [Gammaproteobacteria bacterium]|jgi:hypothetical protein